MSSGEKILWAVGIFLFFLAALLPFSKNGNIYWDAAVSTAAMMAVLILVPLINRRWREIFRFLRRWLAEDEESRARRRQKERQEKFWEDYFKGGRLFVLAVLISSFVMVASQPAMALSESELKTVCSRLSQAAGRSFEVEVVGDEDLNAGVDKDGNIQITSAMLDSLTSADEAAGVLGHEMAHVLGRHYRSQAKQNILGAIVGVLAGKTLGAKGEDLQTSAQVGAGLVGGHRSRKDEYAADLEGARLAYKAGYDPKGLVSVLRRLQGRYGNGDARIPVIGWFASHPDTGERIKRLEAEIGKMNLAQSQSQNSPARLGRAVVVVVDPEASESYGYGFGRGYYYAEDLSRVAKQECEIVLEKRGFRVLVSTQDVGPLQEELELENSEWGARGEGRKPKGYFAGADYIFYVSAYVMQEQNFQVGDWRRQAEVAGLKIGVLLRQIDLESRRQIQTLRGTGSVAALSRARVSLGRDWEPLEVELERIENLARRAVGEAVGKAVSNLSFPAVTSPSEPEWVPPKTANPSIAETEPTQTVYFADVVGDSVHVGEQGSVLLTVQAPATTSKVLFAIYDGEGTKKFEGTAKSPPFQVRIRPEMLRGLSAPKLEAIILSKEGKELGRALVRLIPAP
jgi:Zn-dependent protease with chaperone function